VKLEYFVACNKEPLCWLLAPKAFTHLLTRFLWRHLLTFDAGYRIYITVVVVCGQRK